MPDMSSLQGIDKEIRAVLKRYLKVPSFTNTEGEKLVDQFFNDFISDIEYFKDNPHLYGQYKIKEDQLHRSVNYALLKGDERETVVFLHHSDIVNINNYAEYIEMAFDTEELEMAYKKDNKFLDEESLEDLNSGKWLFGRGTADMKAGGAIQLALLKHYANSNMKDINILVIAVPDEENHSLGMRNAVKLLAELKSAYNLDYKLMINSEPHQRMTEENGVISQGSIAKMNVFVHVKGVLAHAGKALEGLNPNGLLSKIVSEIDLSNDFVDYLENEMSIPPTWVYLRDSKKHNDISFPTSSYGVLNILNFNSTPEMVVNKVRSICENSFVDYQSLINKKRKEFSRITGRDWDNFNWHTKVSTLSEFLKDESIDKKVITSYPEDIEELINSSKYNGPEIIIGLLPPYYPGVTNVDQEKLLKEVNEFTKKMWNQVYDNRMFFTGISDLSYSQSTISPEEINKQMEDMIGWNNSYKIPFDEISKLSMPCINLGPWGKDFHRATERVYIEDLIDRTPKIINNLINNIRGK